MGAGHDHGGIRPGENHRAARRRLAIAFGLTATVVLAQAIGSVVTGSLALLTDTAHALVDASGLLIALIAATMMLRPASSRRTWGFDRMEVLAALAQSALLLAVGVYAAIEAVARLSSPPAVPSTELLIFGVIGLVANVAAILVLAGGHGANLNLRAALLEVMGDALGSLGVIIAAITILLTGYERADTFAALFIVALIVPRALRILRETVRILLEFTPPGVDLDQVRQHLRALEHVRDVHDLHASVIGTGLPVISAHVVVDDDCFTTGHVPRILEDVHDCLRTHFPVTFEHATVQVETAEIRDAESQEALHE